jgi:branched-chain amino acid transport system substrate-binding protein
MTIPAISETSGFAGPAGDASVDGQKVAVAQINSTKYFGNSTLSLTYENTASETAQGVALLNQAITAKAPVVLGSILSTNVAAEAPLAERAGVPLIYLSSDGEYAGLGQWIWAATPPASEYFHWETQYLHNKGIKTAAIIYNNDVSATATWASTNFPPLLKAAGVKLVAEEATPTSAIDVSGVVSKALAANPQAVIVLASGTANNPILLQLHRSGYHGLIAGSIGMAGAINPLGSTGFGVVWATNFNGDIQQASIQKFVTLYEQMFHAAPNNYAAAAYDEVWFLARAIKSSGTFTRAGILKGLQAVGAAGFDGALGRVTYQDNVAVVTGLLIQWNNNEEIPVTGYGS